MQRNELERADTLAQDLQMSQQVTFSDYLLCLEFYRKLDQTKFSALLEKVKPVAARNPSDLALLMDWLNENGLAADVLKWMEKLPVGAHHESSARHRDRGCFRRRKKLVAPETLDAQRLLGGIGISSAGLSGLRLEAVAPIRGRRRIFLALAFRGAGRGRSARSRNSTWRGSRRNGTSPAEAEQLWLRVSKDAPSRREALDALFRIYRANNDLPNLYRTAQRLHESSPNEPSVAADYARLALLVDQNTAEGHRVAKEAYERAPADVNAAMTYAFSLYGLGRSAEGIEIMKKLPAGRTARSACRRLRGRSAPR